MWKRFKSAKYCCLFSLLGNNSVCCSICWNWPENDLGMLALRNSCPAICLNKTAIVLQKQFYSNTARDSCIICPSELGWKAELNFTKPCCRCFALVYLCDRVGNLLLPLQINYKLILCDKRGVNIGVLFSLGFKDTE